MPDLTWSEVVAFDPDLAVLNPVAADAILALVNRAVDPARLGAHYELARLYFAAHHGRVARDLQLAFADGAAGPVTSESVGGISASYGQTAATSMEGMKSTGWGRQYLALIASSGARAGLAI